MIDYYIMCEGKSCDIMIKKYKGSKQIYCSALCSSKQKGEKYGTKS